MQGFEVDAVVLAGGRGTRMGGRDKAELRIAGVTLLDRVLDACSVAGRVVVVGPHRPQGGARRRTVLWTQESPPGGGPVAGIAAGIATLSPATTPVVLVLASDLPELTDAAVQRLLDTLAAAGPDVDAVLFVDAGGRPQPLAAVYRRGALAAALDTADPHGRSMRSLLSGLRTVQLDDGGAAVDCDTPADLWRARRRAAPTQPPSHQPPSHQPPSHQPPSRSRTPS